MISEIALSFAIFMSGITLGVGFFLFQEVKEAKRLYKEKINDFDKILKIVSDANVSMADKILQLEEKVNTMEFRISAVPPRGR